MSNWPVLSAREGLPGPELAPACSNNDLVATGPFLDLSQTSVTAADGWSWTKQSLWDRQLPVVSPRAGGGCGAASRWSWKPVRGKQVREHLKNSPKHKEKGMLPLPPWTPYPTQHRAWDAHPRWHPVISLLEEVWCDWAEGHWKCKHNTREKG